MVFQNIMNTLVSIAFRLIFASIILLNYCYFLLVKWVNELKLKSKFLLFRSSLCNCFNNSIFLPSILIFTFMDNLSNCLFKSRKYTILLGI